MGGAGRPWPTFGPFQNSRIVDFNFKDLARQHKLLDQVRKVLLLLVVLARQPHRPNSIQNFSGLSAAQILALGAFDSTNYCTRSWNLCCKGWCWRHGSLRYLLKSRPAHSNGSNKNTPEPKRSFSSSSYSCH